MNLINAFSQITEFLNKDLSPQSAVDFVIKTYSEELGFDFVMVGYLNAGGIEIKGMTSPDERVKFVDNCVISKRFNEFIQNRKGIHFSSVKGIENILTEMGIKLNVSAGVVLLPLRIKEAVFGVILGVRFSGKSVEKETFCVADAYAGVLSYVIKDAELSNVFKLQLKILNDNVIEKTDSLVDIKEQNEKIREAEKIKTEFLMNMSHSLRTPLNAIIGLSEALEMEIFGKLNKKQNEYIVDIQNSGKEMLGLINDILDMSKIEAGAMRIVKNGTDICLLIKEAVNIIKSLANKKNIKIKMKIPKKPVILQLDAQKINQVLYNLLSNAVKFTKENGNIEVGLKNNKAAIQIYVKDDGIGIDKKYHGKIFGKFEQIDNSYTGKYASTGLGLTITKELIELHNGKIWLESSPDKGTTFIFELPV